MQSQARRACSTADASMTAWPSPPPAAATTCVVAALKRAIHALYSGSATTCAGTLQRMKEKEKKRQASAHVMPLHRHSRAECRSQAGRDQPPKASPLRAPGG